MSSSNSSSSSSSPSSLALVGQADLEDLSETSMASILSTADLPSSRKGGSRPPELSASTIETYHCGGCRKTFMGRITARLHRKNSEMCRKSLETPCLADHDHKFVNLQFETMTDAMNWRLENQFDRSFSIQSAQNDKGIPGSYRAMWCNLSIKTRMPSTRKGKKTMDCSAKLFFNQKEICGCENHDSEWCLNPKQVVMVYGCVKHSHPIDPQNCRISQVVKDKAKELILSGVQSVAELNELLAPAIGQDPESRPLKYDDYYRLKKACGFTGRKTNPSKRKKVRTLLKEQQHFQEDNFEIPTKINESQEDREKKKVRTFLVEFAEVENKMRSMRIILESEDYPMEDKRRLMESLMTPFANLMSASHIPS